MKEFLLWYGVGIVASILARGAIRSGFQANGYKLDPFMVKALLLCAAFSLLGPLALCWAVLWWVCAGFEHYPIWTWKMMQPVKRILNRKIF